MSTMHLTSRLATNDSFALGVKFHLEYHRERGRDEKRWMLPLTDNSINRKLKLKMTCLPNDWCLHLMAAMIVNMITWVAWRMMSQTKHRRSAFLQIDIICVNPFIDRLFPRESRQEKLRHRACSQVKRNLNQTEST
ncbi:hypothetical protein TNCV_1903881 [Trichonephila clavipes]|nr:hypothetical protein TNCV_1903881 [Trichonephila clavipes]